MKNVFLLTALSAVLLVTVPQALAASPQQVCQARKNNIVARFNYCRFRHESGLSKISSVRKCKLSFEKRWKAAIKRTTKRRARCLDAPITNSAYKTYLESRIAVIAELLGAQAGSLPPAQRKCRARKMLEVGRYAACRQRAEGYLARLGETNAYAALIAQCEMKFETRWEAIIQKAADQGAACFDDSRTVADYRLLTDEQVSKIAAVLAGTDLFELLTLSLSGSPFSLTAGGTTGTLTVTNTSAKGIATDIQSDFSSTALEGNVSETGNDCASLAPGASCTLSITSESAVVPTTSFIIRGANTVDLSAVLTILAPPAVIVVTGSPLELVAGGGSGVLSITNTSSIATATNIIADFTGTALEGNVTVTSNTCASVAPASGCTITLTPGNTVVAETDFAISGDNTNSITAAIAIVTAPPTSANISVSGSPLQLTANGSTGNLIITNDSTTVNALNIVSDFTGTALDGNVTESGNTCASLAPAASCTISYTPGSTVVPPTSFTIQGSNTTSITASIEIASDATLSVVSPSTGSASGGTGVLLSGTGLTGVTSVTFGGTPATSVNVINSTTVTAVAPAHAVGAVDVVISTPGGGATLSDGYTYVATAVGQAAHGGIIACLNGGLENLVAAAADNSNGAEWGTPGLVTGAASTSDGASNSATIIAAEGPGAYGAALCNNYEVDSQGNTPCQAGNECYADWYMPAMDQLDCTYTNRVAIGGFSTSAYWTSTEITSSTAMAQVFASGSQTTTGKTSPLSLRCVRSFTP